MHSHPNARLPAGEERGSLRRSKRRRGLEPRERTDLKAYA
jgi:hypothetical protein